MVGLYSGSEISRKGVEAGRASNSKVVLLVLVVLVAGSSKQYCSAQSLDDAVAYLDNVEQEVMRVAALATENFINTCGTFLFPSAQSPGLKPNFLKPQTPAGFIVFALFSSTDLSAVKITCSYPGRALE